MGSNSSFSIAGCAAISVLFSFAGCGPLKPGRAFGPGADRPPIPARLMPDGGAWLVKSKRCGAQALAPTSPEKFVFTDGSFAWISVTSDSAEKQCRQAFAFLRRISSLILENGNLSEVSLLKSHELRVVCRSKVGGVLADPPVSDQTTIPDPADLKLELVVRDASSAAVSGESSAIEMTAKLTQAPECRTDTLELQLVRE
ncbi:MAG: hypothetical protein NDJ89_09545 [Oligoflexia bacterium]|nr:hypothetical protein [Oligoflexia bacterium]